MDPGPGEPSLGRAHGHGPRAFVSAAGPGVSSVPPSGARRSRGREREASCEFLFSQQEKSPKTSPGPAAVTSYPPPGWPGRRRRRARAPRVPNTPLRASESGRPPSSPARPLEEHPARVLGARPRRRARAPPPPAARLASRRRSGAVASRPRLRGPAACLPCVGPRPRSHLGSGLRVPRSAARGPLPHPLVNCRPGTAGEFGGESHLKLEVNSKSHPSGPHVRSVGKRR